MNIILNEKRYVENIMISPSKDNVTSQNLWLVARYYSELGYKKAKIYDLLEHFLLRNDPNCNLVAMSDMIDRAIKGAGKRKLLQLESIPITYAELETVKELTSIREQKVLFTLICLAKLSNEIIGTKAGWVNHTNKEIFELANMYSMTKEKQNLLIHSLYKKGLVAFSKRVDNTNIQVLCLDYDGDSCLDIYDYRNLGNQYLRYLGEPFFECESCGLVVKRNGRRQRFCSSCADEIHRSQMKGYRKIN